MAVKRAVLHMMSRVQNVQFSSVFLTSPTTVIIHVGMVQFVITVDFMEMARKDLIYAWFKN